MDGFSGSAAVLILICVVALLCAVILFYIVSSWKKVAGWQKKAVSDSVTGGLNSQGLSEEAALVFGSKNAACSVVAMQIRNYSQILQTFGEEKSRRVLLHVHTVLDSALGSAEPFARISGGSFCFLMKNVQEDKLCARLLRIQESVNQYNLRAKIPYEIDLRFGIYLPGDPAEAFSLMQDKASAALTDTTNRSRCAFYREPDAEPAARKWELLEQMDRSFTNGGFLLYLQPKVRLSDNLIVGAEASMRWRSPQSGLLTPQMFLPLLEEYRLIERFDLFFFEQLCRQMDRWFKEGKSPCPVSLRISAETLLREGSVQELDQIRARYDIKPELIEVELDSALQRCGQDKIASIADLLHRAGFRCALRDFGAESFALHLLRGINVDTIKLDRNLLSSENNNRRNRFIVEAVIKIAAQLQAATVADGIDNNSQVLYLKNAGCETVQGVCFFAPMSAEEFRMTAYYDKELRYAKTESTSSEEEDLTANQMPGNVVMFSYRLSKDTVQFSHLFSPSLEGHFTVNGAAALFRHSMLIHENDRKDFFHLLERCQKESGWVGNLVRFYTAKGRYEWLEAHLHMEYVKTVDEHVIFGTLVNMSGWKNEVDRWKEKATRDALTGLYNREYFEKFTTSAVEKALLPSAAVVFIDIDDFKRVNDTLGHMIGDDVICYFAKRVLGTFRHSDVCARYGGDEFVVFVNGIGREDLTKRLGQLCDLFRFPYRNGQIEYPVSGSIGAAMYPTDGTTYLELLDRADCALYTAKRQGKNRFVLYEPGMEDDAE